MLNIMHNMANYFTNSGQNENIAALQGAIVLISFEFGESP